MVSIDIEEVDKLEHCVGAEYDRLVVFTNIVCARNQRMSILPRYRSSAKKDSSEDELVILNRASGAFRPGRLTLILGPSGAGKTTLLKILAGRKKEGVRGRIRGAGKSAVFVSQHASLLNDLTARETLRFAARLKLPNSSPKKHDQLIDDVSQQLGIKDVLDTRAGKMSGGEQKRLSIACELLTDPHIMLLDEPTSGLDSVSSMSVIRALQGVAKSRRTVACVVHQPSSKLYSSGDDVIVMANGKTLYAGPISETSEVIKRAGFVCPNYYNMADYLIEIASGEHGGNLVMLETEATNYAYESERLSKCEMIEKNSKVGNLECEALLDLGDSQTKGYSSSGFQQLRALLWRCCLGAVRDVHLTQIRVVSHFVVALLLGTLYGGAGADAARITSNTACLFFFLLFLYFSNAMATINSFPAEALVVIQEHLNKWYSLPAYCVSKILVDLPVQLLCATIFLFPAWYLSSQPMEWERMSLAWTVCILVTILAQTFGMVIGAALEVKLGLFVVPAANIPMLMFSEFFIPYKDMPYFLRPFASISYFRYAFDAFIQSVYGFGREPLPCNAEFCLFRKPEKYLAYLGVSRNFSTDIYVIVGWIILLQASFVFVLWIRVSRSCK